MRVQKISFRSTVLGFVGALAVAATACSSDGTAPAALRDAAAPKSDAPPNGDPSDAFGSSREIRTKEAKASSCGGFEGTVDAQPALCAGERLRWNYDVSTRVLALVDQQASLNCCGERGIEAAILPDGSVEVRESDRPTADAGTRCRCMCDYDFSIALENVPAEPLRVRLVRSVFEEPAPVTLGTWTLNLSEGSGAVSLTTKPCDGG